MAVVVIAREGGAAAEGVFIREGRQVRVKVPSACPDLSRWGQLAAQLRGRASSSEKKILKILLVVRMKLGRVRMCGFPNANNETSTCRHALTPKRK